MTEDQERDKAEIDVRIGMAFALHRLHLGKLFMYSTEDGDLWWEGIWVKYED